MYEFWMELRCGGWKLHRRSLISSFKSCHSVATPSAQHFPSLLIFSRPPSVRNSKKSHHSIWSTFSSVPFSSLPCLQDNSTTLGSSLTVESFNVVLSMNLSVDSLEMKTFQSPTTRSLPFQLCSQLSNHANAYMIIWFSRIQPVESLARELFSSSHSFSSLILNTRWWRIIEIFIFFYHSTACHAG